ncbi:hypothetical protein GCU56_05710 [Geodermatophilus sabuli]|uniref:1-acyl-sn-glycerol-3-phosphate acyltransferase n=1 Tax=Geodermatophilus sabuli TaxID=1564158 RepID=A0A7K3VXJ1_9ACTN|nr:hypothetical protein [Geodermatophilus sabuli]NEK57369.1 hypothetical protein [Geodermatophilus sabuli]
MAAPSAPLRPAPAAHPRWLRVGAAYAAERFRPPLGSPRRRAVCGAARLLTGLGVRVEVRAPSTAWPRTPGRALLVVANSVSALDPLVLLTALPGTAQAAPDRIAGVPVPAVPPVSGPVAAALRRGTSVTVRPEQPVPGRTGLGRFSPTLFAAATETGSPVCPVALRYRGAGDPPPAGRSAVAALRWLGSRPGVVVEVHLLPALTPSGATPAELATLAEYAVAAVLEAPALTPR